MKLDGGMTVAALALAAFVAAIVLVIGIAHVR